VAAVEAALRSGDPSRAASSSTAVSRGPFKGALQGFFDQVRKAESQLAELRAQLGGQFGGQGNGQPSSQPSGQPNGPLRDPMARGTTTAANIKTP
jgi:hypothetical protein